VNRISPTSKISEIKDEGPSPLNYKPKLLDYSPKYSMGGHRQNASLNITSPGPGDYNPEEADNLLLPQLSKTMGPIVTKAQTSRNESPGPGAYNIKYLNGKIQGLKYGDQVK
jgi:hypothetical protein